MLLLLRAGPLLPRSPPLGFARANFLIGEGENMCLFADLWELDVFNNEQIGSATPMLEFATGWEADQVLHLQGLGSETIAAQIRLDLD